jgi:hypothetical protein
MKSDIIFDVENPDHRAACIASQAGFGKDPRFYQLPMEKRAPLGYAVMALFPEVSYNALWQNLIWVNSSERVDILECALKIASLNQNDFLQKLARFTDAQREAIKALAPKKAQGPYEKD